MSWNAPAGPKDVATPAWPPRPIPTTAAPARWPARLGRFVWLEIVPVRPFPRRMAASFFPVRRPATAIAPTPPPTPTTVAAARGVTESSVRLGRCARAAGASTAVLSRTNAQVGPMAGRPAWISTTIDRTAGPVETLACRERSARLASVSPASSRPASWRGPEASSRSWTWPLAPTRDLPPRWEGSRRPWESWGKRSSRPMERAEPSSSFPWLT